MTTGTIRSIKLRGVRVNNLLGLDLDIPHGQMVGICGLSGSGKTSLALDTLYAEGQRRYIECFSPQARQFLGQLEKPDADQIESIPPAIAISAWKGSGGNRTTVGTLTETIDYVRLIYSKIAQLRCPTCNEQVRPASVDAIAERISNLDGPTRFQIGFPVRWQERNQLLDLLPDLLRNGYMRGAYQGQPVQLNEWLPEESGEGAGELDVIVDRLKVESVNGKRLRESIETCLSAGRGECVVLVREDAAQDRRVVYSTRRVCTRCSTQFPEPEPGLFSFNSSIGACPECEGFGNVAALDEQKIFPDRSLTIRQGAIAPWKTPAYEHECHELIELADDYGIDIDVPLNELPPDAMELIWKGVPERHFGGLNGFFAWLEKRRYKLPIRVFLNRWRSDRLCTLCQGDRLNPASLAYKIRNRNIVELSRMPIQAAIRLLNETSSDIAGDRVAEELIRRVLDRLSFLTDVGLEYLSLGRTVRTLSRGELQRVTLTRALGSTLVNVLYVLDEPTIGLHPSDIERLLPSINRLHQSQNTVVIVEHDSIVLKNCERLIEIGPGAGSHGGRITYDGSPAKIANVADSITGQFFSGKRGLSFGGSRRSPDQGSVRITGCRGHNLQDVEAEFPLGVLCVVTGVSGSGKSSLVGDTLGPALRNRKRAATAQTPLDFDSLSGDELIDDVVMIDQRPMTRTSRSNPVTYVKAFDEIRNAFADTVDAKTRNLKPGHFSFNVEGGRCDQCKGEGFVTIDMQFLADVHKRCDQCQGKRFKPDVLAVKYRNRNIAEVLDMTVRTAFSFFRGFKRVQSKLKLLVDVGLDYVPLGQSLSTLSNGESQRLRLASFLGSASRKRILFIMDEPTGGLHMADVVRLVDCFDSLLAVGHSIIVVEHNLQLVLHADHVIELGPGPADNGGRLIAVGTPEQLADSTDSPTGKYLRKELSKAAG